MVSLQLLYGLVRVLPAAARGSSCSATGTSWPRSGRAPFWEISVAPSATRSIQSLSGRRSQPQAARESRLCRGRS
ncbi:MAG: hypothetical protein MZV70_12810 [Desulfobacterales bacterium]|nr:hypothetical protein [Desulfobacterales bacterium]